jgi:hypothetical protein
VRKLTKQLGDIQTRGRKSDGMTPALAAARRREAGRRVSMESGAGAQITSLDGEQAADGHAMQQKLVERQKQMFQNSTSTLDLSKFEIDDETAAALEATASTSSASTPAAMVSFSFIYIPLHLRESCSQFDSLPLTSLTISR